MSTEQLDNNSKQSITKAHVWWREMDIKHVPRYLALGTAWVEHKYLSIYRNTSYGESMETCYRWYIKGTKPAKRLTQTSMHTCTRIHTCTYARMHTHRIAFMCMLFFSIVMPRASPLVSFTLAHNNSLFGNHMTWWCIISHRPWEPQNLLV